jgi:hypothetical protein
MEFSLYRFVVAEGGDLGQVALCHARCRRGQRPGYNRSSSNGKSGFNDLHVKETR